jgi:hypothetical protein
MTKSQSVSWLSWTITGPLGRGGVTDIIDQTKTFRLLEDRIAKTTNSRHLLMLKRLLDHTVGEAKLDLNLVMSTLGANPRYVA